jgi:hypothetical protein
MKTRTTHMPFRATIVILYSLALSVGMAITAFLLSGLRYWGDGSTPHHSLLNDLLYYGLLVGVPIAISIFIVWSVYRQQKGLGYRVLYWLLYATLGATAAFCLLSGDDEALLFGVPTAVFLLAWFPFRHSHVSPSESGRVQNTGLTNV